MTLDKSKKVGRFRRRERGVSHVFAIFFFFRGPNFSTPFSFPRAKFSSRPYFLTYLSPFITFFLLSAIDNRRTNGQRTRENKGKDLLHGFRAVQHWRWGRGTRHTSDLSSTTDHSVRIRHRGMTIVEFETVLSSSSPTMLSFASLFSRTDSEIRRCPYNYYYGRGGNTESRPLLRLFLWFEILLPSFAGKNIFARLLFFFSILIFIQIIYSTNMMKNPII